MERRRSITASLPGLGCGAVGTVDTFLRVEGEGSRDVAPQSNELRQARNAFGVRGGFTGTVAESDSLRRQP